MGKTTMTFNLSRELKKKSNKEYSQIFTWTKKYKKKIRC